MTVDELERLNPATVTVVGGTPSVSSAVVAQIAAAVPGASISQIAGVDRYETAQLIAQRYFGQASHAFIASGEKFADAISASGVASAIGNVPVLLTPRGSTSEFTLDALEQLGAESAHVLGSRVPVADAVVRDHRAAGVEVDRIAGSDRYATNALLSEHFIQPSGDQAVAVASGTNFPTPSRRRWSLDPWTRPCC